MPLFVHAAECGFWSLELQGTLRFRRNSKSCSRAYGEKARCDCIRSGGGVFPKMRWIRALWVRTIWQRLHQSHCPRRAAKQRSALCWQVASVLAANVLCLSESRMERFQGSQPGSWHHDAERSLDLIRATVFWGDILIICLGCVGCSRLGASRRRSDRRRFGLILLFVDCVFLSDSSFSENTVFLSI